MPSQTFLNLNPDKQARIQAALLTEFSHHPLAKAQVARIVKEAQIARGAFYKYFADLTDAYQYLWGQVLHQIHSKDELRGQLKRQPADYANQVRQFLTTGEEQGLCDLLRLHYTVNEAQLDRPAPVVPGMRFDATTWAVMTLTHQAMRECLADADRQEEVLGRLEAALTALMKGAPDVSGN